MGFVVGVALRAASTQSTARVGLGSTSGSSTRLYDGHFVISASRVCQVGTFMVTQGMRDRETLQVRPEMTGATGAGAVNPAQIRLDFYIRSPETNDANHPNREVFDHFLAMDVTWH